jgi:CheY-like chemotaxis protein
MTEDKFHILLLEDNPADVYLFNLAFTRAELNYELILFEDGAEAIAYIEGKGKYAASPVPDLVVLDLNVPKNDGSQVLKALRNSPRFAAVPVAIATSSAAPGERAKAEQMRVELFLTKPPDLSAFLKMGLLLKDLLVKTKSRPTSP